MNWSLANRKIKCWNISKDVVGEIYIQVEDDASAILLNFLFLTIVDYDTAVSC